jgi:hypothetical protein
MTKHRRLVSAVLAALLVLTLVPVEGIGGWLPMAYAVTQADIDALKGDASELASQRSDIKSQLAELKNQRSSALKQLELLDQQIALTEREIKNTEDQISGYEALLSQTALAAVTVESKLVCGKDAHTHTDSCYGRGEQTCALTEAESHTHDTSCYTEGEAVLSCGQTETEGHTHGDGCYDADGNMTCTLVESEGHAHGDSCYMAGFPAGRRCPRVIPTMTAALPRVRCLLAGWKSMLTRLRATARRIWPRICMTRFRTARIKT